MKSRSINIVLLLIPILTYGQTSREIEFTWKAAESDSQKFEKAVMLVPIKFKSDTTTYFLQFDTGATHSYLYSNRIELLDSGDEYTETSIGKINFKDSKSIQATDGVIASIGTLGADWLKNKVVQINFIDQTIKVDHPYNYSDFIIKPLHTLNGRPVLEVTVDGKKQNLLYDTGSSLFGIWTDKRNWKELRENSDIIESFPITSWGRVNLGYYSSLSKTIPPLIEDFNHKPDLKVWYVDNKKFRKFFRQNDLLGILGNQPFLHQEILLDYKKGVLGIKTVCKNE